MIGGLRSETATSQENPMDRPGNVAARVPKRSQTGSIQRQSA
jgi:hypothetical protein